MTDDIRQWLEELGLGKYGDVFVENEVGVRDLPGVTSDDLKELGLPLGPRRRVLLAVETSNEVSTAVSDTNTDETETTSSTAATTPQAERRQLTVMFCDLVGSTALSRQLDPEDLRDVMRRYQDAVAGAVTRYGGHVAKYLGDGVLAYFGWPQAYEDQAERAVRAGLDAVTVVNDVQIGDGRLLEARVGIATGQVVVGDLVGEGGRDTEAVTGETPNLAARLQGVAEPGQVIISDTTRQLVGQTFALNDMGQQDLKGFDQQPHAWNVVGEQKVESRFEAAHGTSLTRLIGRDGELQLLLDRWELAKNGEGQVVLISGEAGIGKSRLSQGLRDALSNEGNVRVRYQCSPYHINSALYPTIQQLQHAAGFEADDDIEAKLGKLEELLRQGSDDIDKAAPLFANLLSLPNEDRYGSLGQGPAQIKQETLQAIIDQMLQLAARQPLLFLLEDAHWIDPTSLELLQHTVSRTNSAPVLMVISHRLEWQSPFAGQDHVTSLQLNRLGKSQGTEIVRAIAGECVSDDVVERIVSRTDGVPLFVEELTKSLVEGGLDLADADIPATLQASLLARLDRLGNETKEFAQIGAAIGREFPYALIKAVTTDRPIVIEAALQRLVQSQLVSERGSPPDTSYVFKHALVQDAAYESILRSRRRDLHNSIGLQLERQSTDGQAVEPALLAHHFEKAGETQSAINHWETAAQEAIQSSAELEAVRALQNAIRLNGTLGSSEALQLRELDLQLMLGSIQSATAGYGSDAVLQTFERAVELAKRSELPSLQIRALVGYGTNLLNSLDRAEPVLREALRLAEASKLPHEAVYCRSQLGMCIYLQGRSDKSLDIRNEGFAAYQPEGYHQHYIEDPGVLLDGYRGVDLAILGYGDQALHIKQAAIHAGSNNPNISSRCFAFIISTVFHCYRREGDLALQDAETALAIANEHHFGFWMPHAALYEAWAQNLLGRGPERIDALRSNLRTLRDSGVIIALQLFSTVLGEAFLQAEEPREAIVALDEGLGFVQQTQGHHWEPELHRLRARALSRLDADPVEVEGTYQQAIKVAQGQRARMLELRAALDLARLLKHQHRSDEAHGLVAPLYAWFTEGFDTPDLIEAKALLDELDKA